MAISLMIVKRTGTVVEFDSNRIKSAISKAINSTGNKIPIEKIDVVVDSIIDEIRERFVDINPNVENIQDIVEKHLVKHDLYEIAKEYILYRAERNKEREAEKEKVTKKSILGKLRVKNSEGKLVSFDVDKLKQHIIDTSKGFEKYISIEQLSKETIRNIYDGVTTDEIQKALILASVSLIEKDPIYSYLGGRLFLQIIYKEAIGPQTNNSLVSSDEYTFHEKYRETFIKNIEKAVELGLIDKRLLEFNIKSISQKINPERDNLLQYMGIQTLYDRYFIKVNKKVIEAPQMFWMRVSMGLAINEKDKNKRAEEFYEILSSMRFISSTPTLFHSGTSNPQLSSCYLTTVMDDLKHIFKCIGDNAQLSKWSGGLGNDWSNIRSTGSFINSTKVDSQGLIPFLKIANDVTAAINRGGKRRGATCAYLETWHLDIIEFLDLRKNTGDERRRTHDMNTANWIPDLFIKRVINNENWTLFSPSETPELHHIYGKKFDKKYVEYEEKAKKGEIVNYKIMPAQKLWKKMLSMLFETGHPWITFKDPCNIRSPQDHQGIIHSSNLCTEITLNTSEEETAVCNLGSINISKHIINGELDKELLAKTVKTAMRMLDNVIDINFYPTDEAKNSNILHRPVGLGIMGSQDAFYKLDIGFESDEALKFTDEVMEFISYNAILESSELAKEKGTYESYKESKWDRGIFPIDTLKLLEEERGIPTGLSKEETLDWKPVRDHVKQYGMRNSNTMAIAPTATISTIVGCYPSIEPIYKNIYVKSNMSGEFTVVNSFLIEDLKKLKLWNKDMLDQLKYYDGSIQLIPGIPQNIKDKYKSAFEIDPLRCIEMTATRGKWIDQSQSHNVFMHGTSGKKLEEIYLYAWKIGMKTTYYLRTLAASQVEKSTLDASKYGFTQKREYDTKLKNVQVVGEVCEACE